MSRRSLVVVVPAVLAVLVVLAATMALAGFATDRVVVSGGGVTAVTAVSDPGAQSFEAPTGIKFLEGSGVKMPVRGKKRAFFVATFEAESTCESSTGDGECYLFVRMGGPGGSTDLNPRDDDTAFDSVFPCIGPGSCPDDGLEAHAIRRSSDIVGPGLYTFRVGLFVTGAETEFRLDDWHFTVEQVSA